ncbi:MAG: hypothetical protein II955_01605 [Clostridia bacterium]|nr:hypothetical protein [Clostridia bacterium]
MKKRFILLLAIVLLLSASLFASCVKKPGGDPTPPDPPKDEVAEAIGFAKQNYGNREFKILLNNSAGFDSDFIAESTDSDTVKAETYRRNSACEEYLGISLIYDPKPGNWNSSMPEDLRQLIMTDSCDYDLVVMGLNTGIIGGEISSYKNIMEMNSVNLNHSWWVQDMVEQNSINEQLYFLCGDACTTNYSSIGCVFANLSVAEQFNVDVDFYQLVNDGNWTMEEFYTQFKKVSMDANSDDGALDPAKGDTVGWLVCEDGVPVRLMWSGCGFNLISRQDNGTFALCDRLDDRMITFISGLKAAWDDEHSAYAAATSDKTSAQVMVDTFVDNRAFLVASMLKTAESFQTSQIRSKFAFLPLPKYNADQVDYISTNMARYNALFFPVVVKDPTLSGQVAEFMGYYGQRYIIPAYYDTSLKYRQNDAEANIAMLDLIREKLIVTPNESYGVIGGSDSIMYLTQLNPLTTGIAGKNFYTNPTSVWETTYNTIYDKIDSYVFQYYQ